jgi:hypothetical protein
MPGCLDEALSEIKAAISLHEKGEAAPFSIALLRKISAELQRMQAEPTYIPGYARFLLDWPDSGGDLGRKLIEAQYYRQKSAKP